MTETSEYGRSMVQSDYGVQGSPCDNGFEEFIDGGFDFERDFNGKGKRDSLGGHARLDAMAY